MKKAIVILVFIGLLILAACGALSGPQGNAPAVPYTWESPLPPSLARTPQAAQAAAQATIAAGQAAMAGVQLTAAVVSINMTQAAATATAQGQAQQATATAKANATATAQAIWAAHATATRDAALFAMTQAAATLEFRATQGAVQAQGTALAVEAERERLAVEQQQMMNQVWAVTKWALPVLLLLAIAIAVVILVRQWTRMRIIRRPDGKVLVLVNGMAIYDPDRNPTPILQVGPDGVALPPVSEETQAATTARDQAVALARATGRKPPRNLTDAPQPPLRFRIIQPGERPPVALDGDTVEVLEAQWREADE